VNINPKSGGDLLVNTISTGRVLLSAGAGTNVMNINSAGGSFTSTNGGFSVNTGLGQNINLTTTGVGDVNLNTADKIVLSSSTASTSAGIDILTTNAGSINIQTGGLGDITIFGEDLTTITGKAGATLRTTLGSGADVSVVSTRDILLTPNNTTGRIILTSNNLTATAIPNHSAQIQTTTNGVNANNYLKMTLNGSPIWIPYFTTDPTV
jgi:hypothetical protein